MFSLGLRRAFWVCSSLNFSANVGQNPVLLGWREAVQRLWNLVCGLIVFYLRLIV